MFHFGGMTISFFFFPLFITTSNINQSRIGRHSPQAKVTKKSPYTAMGSLSHSIIRSFLIFCLVVCISHAFSLDGGRRSCSFGVPSVVRHRRHPSCYYSIINEPTVRSSSLTIRWSSVESTSSAENTQEKQQPSSPSSSLDLHLPTIQAISTALLTHSHVHKTRKECHYVS